MTKKPQGGKKKTLLEGHKRVGKRFIPPMLQIPQLQQTSFVDDILPELVWIGLLNDQLGYVRGARVIEQVFRCVEDLRTDNQHGNFALMSTYRVLNASQKSELANRLDHAGPATLIRVAIAPLVLLYDDCPLNFFGPPSAMITEDELVARMRHCIGRTIDRYETPATVLYGAMLIYRLVSKTIQFSRDMELPNFNAVIDAPESEEAKRAAGFMRANVMSEFASLNLPKAWAKHFWSRNFAISPCERNQEECENGEEF